MNRFSGFNGIAKIVAIAAIAIAAIWSRTLLAADEYNHLVRIIVPYAPGGTSDILARILAPRLSSAIGQTVIVENKTGAAGNVGADAVAKAPKDGHTLLLCDVGSIATSPSLFSNLTYDAEKDLTPVGMIMFAPFVLAVHKSVPVSTAQELIKFGQTNPGKLAIANSGIGGINHIAALIVGKQLNINWKYVPYKGGAAASRAVVSGESNTIINGATATLPFVTNGQLVGLAVTGKSRLKTAPNLPTFRELGLPADDYGTFQGIFATAGTPLALIQRMNEELRKILAMPEIQQKIAEQGGEVLSGSPDDMKRWLRESIQAYGAEIRAAGIKAE